MSASRSSKGGLVSTSGESYLLSLQSEQKKKKSEEHGVERKIQHMIYGGMVLAIVWVALSVREQGIIDSQTQAAALGAQAQQNMEDSFDGFVGDFIHPSLAEEVKNTNVNQDENFNGTALGTRRINFGSLLRSTSGWVSLLLIVAAAVLTIKEGNNQQDSGKFAFPPLPSANQQSSSNTSTAQKKGGGNGRYGTPRRGTVGDIQPLGVDMKGGGNNNTITHAVPARKSFGNFGSLGGLGGGSSGALGGGGSGVDGQGGDLGRLLEDDRRYIVDKPVASQSQAGTGGAGGSGVGAGTGLFSGGVRPLLDGGRTLGGGSDAKNRGMHVNFGSVRGRDETSKQAADAEGWKALGVKNPELATLRIAEWMNKKLLQEVVKSIDECNKWWGEKQLTAFDCTNSLHDLFELRESNVSSAPTWGTGNSNTKGRKVIPKIDALKNEKEKLLQNKNNLDTYELIVQIDKRLKLEELLHVDRMFGFKDSKNSSGATSVYESEASRRQAYIIRRVRSLASQPTLNGYKPAGGEPEVWCEEYPTDAYLLCHLLMHQIPCFARHLKHPQQPMTEKRDLAIYLGSTGEPYFYVKYRNPPAVAEKIFHTKQGYESLFQAVLIFIAIIAKYHDSAYGSVFGVVELKDLDLDQVVRS